MNNESICGEVTVMRSNESYLSVSIASPSVAGAGDVAFFHMDNLDVVHQLLDHMRSMPLPKELIVGEIHRLDAYNLDRKLLRQFRKRV